MPAATDTPTPIPTVPPTEPSAHPTDTPRPTEAADPVKTSTPRPTTTGNSPPSSSQPSSQVSATTVVYHSGENQDGVGVYVRGILPWMDLLVRMGDTWYGPEREPNDGINAQPLPDGYAWECTGGFGCHPNGEAWWAETSDEGTAKLTGPSGAVLVEVPLKIVIRGAGEIGGGGGGGGDIPTLTPAWPGGPTEAPAPTTPPEAPRP